MTFIPNEEFYLKVAKGEVPKHSIVHKFGSSTINSTLSLITQSNVYMTPTTATALEVVSDNVADALNGVGMHEVTVIGLDSNYNEVTQVISAHATSGTTAVAIPTNLIRLYRWYVSKSGTYAMPPAGSHQGTLVIQEAGGGTVWSGIPVSSFATGQSQIGMYTIPIGYTGYLLSKNIYIDTGKKTDIYLFQRPLANDVTSSYTGTVRLMEREVGISGGFNQSLQVPNGKLVGPCDIGFLGKLNTGTAPCSVEFELLLVQD